MAEERIYTIVVKRQRVEVSRSVYHAYHQAREAERYQRKLIADNEYSLERFQEDGVNVEYRPGAVPDFVDRLVLLEQEHQLRLALRTLTVEERLLIHELFYNGKSERELSAMIAVPQKTINDRKRRILAKLRRQMEI